VAQRKPVRSECPPHPELEELKRKWGASRIHRRTVRYPDLDVSRDYEPCKGEGVSIVVGSGKRVLLARRYSPEILSGPRDWTLPSGRIRPNETVEEGTAREIWEETGLEANLVKLVRVEWVNTEFKTWINERMHFVFLAEPIGGELGTRDRDEIRDLKWFSLESVPPHIQQLRLWASMKDA